MKFMFLVDMKKQKIDSNGKTVSLVLGVYDEFVDTQGSFGVCSGM